MLTVYYSRSNEVNDKEFAPHLKAFVVALCKATGKKVRITQHKRDTTYKPQLVLDADVILVGSKVNTTTPNIAKGCYTEINTALAHDIPVFALSDESTKINSNPRGIYCQKLKAEDLNVLNSDVWTQGHSFISLYCTPMSEYGMAFLNNDYLFSEVIEKAGISSVISDTSGSTESTLQCEYERMSSRSTSDFLNMINPVKETERKNLLLVRRRMRR